MVPKRHDDDCVKFAGDGAMRMASVGADLHCRSQRAAAAAADAVPSAVNFVGGHPCVCNPLWPLYLTAATLSSLSSSTSDFCRSHSIVFAGIRSNFIELHGTYFAAADVWWRVSAVNYRGKVKNYGCTYCRIIFILSSRSLLSLHLGA